MKILLSLTLLFLLNTSFASSFVEKQSKYNFKKTVTLIKENIQSFGLNIFSEIDHQAGATKVSQVLRPTTLLIFGSPKVGTLLMDKNQRAGLDLPLKLLIHENASGNIIITYKDPQQIKDEYKIRGLDKIFNKVSNVLSSITKNVTK